MALDLNGDGLNEIAYGRNDAHAVGVFVNQGNGIFSARHDYVVGYGPTSLAAGDWNNDGRMDFAAQNTEPQNVTILSNTCLP